MNVWIITTGSSDVQLQNQDNWNNLQKKVRNELKISKQFSPSETEQNGKKLFRYPARATGVVYSNAITEHYADLEFPLLNSFSSYLKDKFKKEQTDLNRVIVLLTDQSEIVSAADKNKISHFYWQDTCTLQPILQQHLQNQFPDVIKNNQLDFRVLKPEEGSRGLDDWNEVLTLVQKEFIELSIPQDATVYVSHQAGTPAISSAVQFSSLTKFGDRVKFLVSSERDPKLTTVLESSTYLQEIRLQEAKALLARHDYAGVQELLSGVMSPKINKLLDAAIQWSCAEFEKFAEKVCESSDDELCREVKEHTQQKKWWWTAYESAYLGVIRLKQENTVEAMFHSFRAVEGLLLKWAIQNNDITVNDKKIRFEKSLTLPNGTTRKQEKKLNAYGKGLYLALEELKGVDKAQNSDIWEFGHHVFDQRNEIFHKLAGLNNKEAVFEKWHLSIKSEEAWETRILNCLNFVAGDDKLFNSLKEASPMSKVHEKLEKELSLMSASNSGKSE